MTGIEKRKKVTFSIHQTQNDGFSRLKLWGLPLLFILLATLICAVNLLYWSGNGPRRTSLKGLKAGWHNISGSARSLMSPVQLGAGDTKRMNIAAAGLPAKSTTANDSKGMESEKLRHLEGLHPDLKAPALGARLPQLLDLKAIVSDTPSNAIPKILHQSWKSAVRIPARFAPWVKSWMQFNPDWKYVFWDDFDNEKLIRNFFPEYQGLFYSLGSGVARADFSRYALLYQFGGVYADMDFECKASFSDLLERFEGFLSSEPRIHAKLLEGRDGIFVCNAILASRPRHPFWMAVMKSVQKAVNEHQGNDPVSLTGPRRVHQVYYADTELRTGIELVPEDYFYPEFAQWNKGNLDRACTTITPNNRVECQLLKDYPNGRYTNNTHAVHHWECTWCRGERSDQYLPITSILSESLVIRPFKSSKPLPNALLRGGRV